MPLISPASVMSRPNEPNPEGVVQAFARIGYRLEEALADIVDNSVDAAAMSVLIRFYRTAHSIDRIAIVDDGIGIAPDQIDASMQFGARIQHKKTHLGKYGIGLKSASFSQCRSLYVLSRTAGRTVGRKWTVESIRDGWLCEHLEPKSCSRIISDHWGHVAIGKHGTVILWDEIDRIKTDQGGTDAALNKIFKSVPLHLGMVFHRFIGRGDLRIALDTYDLDSSALGPSIQVEPLDPFDYRRSGRPSYPRTLTVNAMDAKINLVCHIWPPNAVEPQYKLGGRTSQRQGFYFYRNDRLIQAGGWNGWREDEAEPHLSLARVLVDLPTSLDATFGLNVQKSGVDLGPGFKRLLDGAKDGTWTLRHYVRDAIATYRNARSTEKEGPLVPGTGLPAVIRRMLIAERRRGSPEPRRVAIRWKTLPVDEVFRIDRSQLTLLLNNRHKRAMVANGDGDVLKLLTFLLLRDEFDRERVRATRSQWLILLNQMLLLALTSPT
jgi:Histidine kinase-, DNA gyrase B-, and HSP90-like ATPase